MTDFEALYHKMLLASNKALEIIQRAQFECENMYAQISKNNDLTNYSSIIDYNEIDDFIDIDESINCDCES